MSGEFLPHVGEEVDTLTVTNARVDGKTVGLRCVRGVFEAIGPEVAPLAGDETLDAGGAPLVAPLINGHTHAAMTLLLNW